ncbi:MAG: NAD(P)H-dependent glycerol-3-phosphate dehydrogenase [Verrucomicrobiota bacterium JB022]|nr:NAD(P)H-dependent glycerol-3-phosphate dehydrogenase [Verrucomicrobiota bacterium JB022]
MNFCIYPAGAWGTALALHLVRENHTVTLVPRELDHALEMASSRVNRRYLDGVELPRDVQLGMELAPSLMEADVLVLACPSRYLRGVCREIRSQLYQAEQLEVVLTLCKGLEEGTNALPTAVVAEELPQFAHGALSGPSFASQVAAGQPTALVLSTNLPADKNEYLQQALSGERVRVYTSDDLTGVELGGCLKNVYAIAVGMCDGLGLRDNTKAALLTRALHEMVRVGEALGGKRETFYGLTGFGDLVLTCNGAESRNRTFGERVARGESAEQLIAAMTVEGYRTTACFHRICQDKGVEAPILEQIYQILFEGRSLREAIPALMGRQLKPERA